MSSVVSLPAFHPPLASKSARMIRFNKPASRIRIPRNHISATLQSKCGSKL